MSDISAFGVGQLCEDKLQALKFFRVEKLEKYLLCRRKKCNQEEKSAAYIFVLGDSHTFCTPHFEDLKHDSPMIFGSISSMSNYIASSF